jgi:hypothetical protein
MTSITMLGNTKTKQRKTLAFSSPQTHIQINAVLQYISIGEKRHVQSHKPGISQDQNKNVQFGYLSRRLYKAGHFHLHIH